MSSIERNDIRGPVVIESIGGDLRVRGHSGSEILIEGDNPEISQQYPEAPFYIRCSGDCDVRMPEYLALKVKVVGGDAKITNLVNVLEVDTIGRDLILRHITGQVTIGNVGSDFVAKHLDSSLAINTIGSDATIQNVAGNVVVDLIGSDLELREVTGSCQFPQVGSDISMTLDFIAGNTYHFNAGSDVSCILRSVGDVTFVLPRRVAVEIDEDSIDATLQIHNAMQKVVLGEGGAEVYVQGDSFELSSSRQSKSFTFDFDFDTSLGDIEKRINDSLSGLGQIIETRTQEAINQATSFAKNIEGRWTGEFEQAQRQAERHAARAMRHAERFQRYTSRRRDEDEPVKNWEPVSNEERILILKMVQEGKISVEEAEKLLSTLEGNS